MTTLIIYLVIIIPIVYFFTRKQSMSFGWGLFFCIFYSIAPGVIIILLSGKEGYSNKYKHKDSFWYYTKTVLCFIAGITFIIYSLSTYYAHSDLYDNPAYSYFYNKTEISAILSLGIGFLGNSIYLVSSADEEYIPSQVQ